MSYELGNEIYVTNWNKNQMIDTSFGSTILLEESVKAILQDILPTNIKNNSLCLMEEKVKTFYSRSNTVIEYLYSTSPDPREMRYPLGQLKQSRTEWFLVESLKDTCLPCNRHTSLYSLMTLFLMKSYLRTDVLKIPNGIFQRFSCD